MKRVIGDSMMRVDIDNVLPVTMIPRLPRFGETAGWPIGSAPTLNSKNI